MCDNEEDCSDGSDEDPKECSSKPVVVYKVIKQN